MANSADPDHLASSEANWSGSTLFAKQDISGSAGQVLKFSYFSTKLYGMGIHKSTAHLMSSTM